MKIKSIINDDIYLSEYISLCNLEWGNIKDNIDEYIIEKKQQIKNGTKVIEVLALISEKEMIGFISLFNYDGSERKDLSPWYSTMYVKNKYRGKGYSKILNNALLEYAKDNNYKKVYLKSNLKNYYEKYGAKYIETLSNGECLFYIDIV